MNNASEKYSVTQYSISSILGYIDAGDIAIPEIQRPFVWKGKQVRDLIDSLYNGYPTGYLIIWQNPDVKLKNGERSVGKKILIDGQQRVTALMTAIGGYSVLNENYEQKQIAIAFNPLAQGEEEVFAVRTPAHDKSSFWIPDISIVFRADFDSDEFIDSYAEKNPDKNYDSYMSMNWQAVRGGTTFIPLILMSIIQKRQLKNVSKIGYIQIIL